MNWVVLLRGVNVGGKGKLPMKELRTALSAQSWCREAQSYIQSGNLVLDSDLKCALKLAQAVRQTVEREFGFSPQTLALDAQSFRDSWEHNPFQKEVGTSPKSVHFYFLDSKPESPQMARLERLLKESETLKLTPKLLYLHAPEGIGRSKAAAAAEKCLGVPATARNGNTVLKLLAML